MLLHASVGCELDKIEDAQSRTTYANCQLPLTGNILRTMAKRGCDPLVAMKPEDCPVRATVDVIGGKWKPLILFYLKHRTMRFNEFRRMIPDATHKMLAQQLRDLERAEVIIRKVYPEVPPRVEYSLSASGETLRPVLAAMAEWGEGYRQRHPAKVKSWKQPPVPRISSSSGDRRAAQI